MEVQTDLNSGTKILWPQLDSVMQSYATANKPSWRHSAFNPPANGGEFGAGVLNMSPGWFQLLQDVSLLLAEINHDFGLLVHCQQLDKELYVSSHTRTDEAADFLKVTTSLDVMCNAITALIGPQQYDAGLEAICLLKSGSHLHDTHPNLDYWGSVWSGFAIIVNRSTFTHRDTGAAPADYDLLVSSGTHKQCTLDVHDLGLKLSYPPGTGVAVAGKVLRHGVKGWEGGERICQARFMKDAVHDRLGQPRPNWVCHEDYINLTSK